MIEIEGLSVRFSAVRALDALDARLTEPVCGLIGPNGAGKTTLVNLLSGLVRAEAGQVRVDGTPLLPMTTRQRVRFGLRRSFQTEQVVEDLSVWDNVQAMLDHVPAQPGAGAHQVERILAYTDLTAVATELGEHLNLFQRRMVELARTLAGRPRLLLLDEPAAGLDERESALLQRAVLGIHAWCGAQVLLIDHDMALIAATCSQTLVLDFGRRVALGPTRAVLDDPAVRRAYLGS